MAPRRENFEERKAAIVAAATKVFASKGYAATNREIAVAAGVTAAALYWYFPSKEDLFRAVIGQVKGRAEAVVSRLDDMGEIPPREALTRLAHAMLEVISAPDVRDVLRCVFLSAGSYPEVGRVYSQEIFMPVSARVFAYFQSQIDRGIFRPVPAPALAMSFIGPLGAAVMMGIVLGAGLPPVPPELLVAPHVETFLHGALARKG